MSTASVYGQIDTTRKEFFPLHLGDIWQYRNEFGNVVRTSQVVRMDSLLPNGYRYVATGRPPNFNTGYAFVRIDSLLRVQHFGGWGGDSCGGTTSNDISTYRLGERDRTVWRDCLNFGGYLTRNTIVQFTGIVQVGAFGRLRDAMLFRFGGVFPAPIDTFYGSSGILVKGIGLFRQEYYESLGFDQLTGAIINGVTYGTIVGVEEIAETYPRETRLFQNYPNPFNPITTINFDVPKKEWVRLTVFDVLGREVAVLVDGEKEQGSYSVVFNAQGISSGVYFYRLKSGGAMLTKKMIVQK